LKSEGRRETTGVIRRELSNDFFSWGGSRKLVINVSVSHSEFSSFKELVNCGVQMIESSGV